MAERGGLTAADYAKAGDECDVVMKGGITSGVVYPKAICELAARYRFRNVGGTSAGAIAAAATAAAEYGRDREGGGFETLAQLPDWLGGEGHLIGLFQPQPSTRRLHGVLIAGLAGRGKAAVKAALSYVKAVCLGALPGVLTAAMLVVAGAASGSTVLLVLAILFALLELLVFGTLGAVLGAGFAIVRDLNVEVTGNGFGLCSGMPTDPDDRDGAPALTPWLHSRIEACAGHRDREAGDPLTFGDLWRAPGQALEDVKGEDDRHINLAMMTTNLINRCADQFPWDTGGWFFSPEEFAKLFPPEVVAHMVDLPAKPHGSDPARTLVGRGLAARQGLRPLPEAADLPVIVATRMSLSFPVLLSAVPLWRFDYGWKENADRLEVWREWGTKLIADGREGVLADPDAWSTADPPSDPAIYECCWFSDGGISSNFPVHFFDRLVPRRPTFAIDLRPFPFGKPPSADQAKNVEMAERNNQGILDWWYRFPLASTRFFGLADGRLRAFLGSAVKTMQNRSDEAQMRVPGYRDRIAHVNLTGTEGGMNLDMDETKIRHLTERGQAAARRLIEAYDPARPPGPGVSWRNQRWVRFRSSLAVLEQMSAYFTAGVSGRGFVDGPAPLIEDADSYELAEWQKKLAREEVATIEAFAAAVASAVPQKEPPGMAWKAPSPPPVGRIAPKE